MKRSINKNRIVRLIKANITENFNKIKIVWLVFTVLIGFVAFMVIATNSHHFINNIAFGAKLLKFTLGVGVVSVIYIGEKVFKNSTKKEYQLFRYALPASLIEKYIANVITTLFVVPLFPIASFIAMMIVPSIMFHIFNGVEDGFYIFSVVEQAMPSPDVALNFISVFLIFMGIIMITSIYYWGAKKAMKASGLTFGLLLYFAMSRGYDALLLETSAAVSFIIYPALAVAVWILSYYSFKRKELKQ